MSNIHGVAEDDARLAEHYGIDLSRRDGGPAFPSDMSHPGRPGSLISWSGMSHRDWLAGQALCGLMHGLSSERFKDILNGIQAGGNEAKVAYTFADAMLAERAKR